MKKLFALTLAVAMVLSLASMSFAAVVLKAHIDPSKVNNAQSYEFDDDDDVNVMIGTPDSVIPYGGTAFYPIMGKNTSDGKASLVFESDAVKGLKLKGIYDLGKEYVEKTYVAKKKVNTAYLTSVLTNSGDTTATGGRSYAYFVAVEIADKMTTSTKYISGRVEMDKSGTKDYASADELDYDDHFISVDLTLEYEKESADSGFDVGEDRMVYEFDQDDDENEFYLVSDDIASFTVDTRGQGKMVMAANNDFISSIASKYPAANLDFITVETSSSFNRIGELRVFAEEGMYLYSVGSDGKLKDPNAKYDSSDEAYIMRTRTLGSFVLSDIKLDVASDVEVPEVSEPSVEVPTTPTIPENPATGAAC